MLLCKRFYALLEQCCLATADDLFTTILPAAGLTTVHKRGQRYAYRRGRANNSPLLVCHADTVVDDGNGKHNYKRVNNLVNSIALDDRLGLSLILFSLERYRYDIGSAAVLVCDDEEIGDSSAGVFDSTTPNITPNWLMEFDRHGVDAVTYGYKSPLWHGLLESQGFDIGRGSFSDICYLEHLGVCGVNVGIGYHREHSTKCYANLIDTAEQFQIARTFFRKFHDVPMVFEPAPRYTGKSGRSNFHDFDFGPSRWPTGLADDFDGLGLPF